MKIFSKFYVRALDRAFTCEEVVNVLIPWVEAQVNLPTGNFMQQVAVHALSNYNAKKKLASKDIFHLCVGHTNAPFFFKKEIGKEILRLTGKEDLRQIILLAIVITYRKYDPRKKGDFVQYLARQIPYFVSYWITYKVFKPLEPFEMFTEQPDLDLVQSELESLEE